MSRVLGKPQSWKETVKKRVSDLLCAQTRNVANTDHKVMRLS